MAVAGTMDDLRRRFIEAVGSRDAQKIKVATGALKPIYYLMEDKADSQNAARRFMWDLVRDLHQIVLREGQFVEKPWYQKVGDVLSPPEDDAYPNGLESAINEADVARVKINSGCAKHLLNLRYF